MRVLMLVDNLNIGGTETHVLSISKDLIHRNIEVLVATQDGEFIEVFNKNNIKTVTMEFNEKNLISLINKFNIDIIHCHLLKSMNLAAKVHALIKVPYIITLHGLFYPEDDLNNTCTNSSHIIAVSEIVKNMLLKSMKVDVSKKVSVLYNTFNLDLYKTKNINIRKKLKIHKDEKIIVYCSRLSHTKGLLAEQFIHVFYEIANKHKNVHAVVIGDGPKKPALDFYSKSLNNRLNKNCIHIIGPTDDVISYYKESYFVVGTGRVAIEAMSCKKPVIAMGLKSLEGLVSLKNADLMVKSYFGDHGFTDKKNMKYLEYTMKYLISNEDTCETLGNWSYAWVNEKFNNKEYAKELITIYYRYSRL